MTNPRSWFKLYNKVIHSESLTTLGYGDRWLFIELMSLANEADNAGKLPNLKTICRSLSRQKPATESALSRLIAVGLLEQSPNKGSTKSQQSYNNLEIRNWSKYQAPKGDSPVSTTKSDNSILSPIEEKRREEKEKSRETHAGLDHCLELWRRYVVDVRSSKQLLKWKDTASELVGDLVRKYGMTYTDGWRLLFLAIDTTKEQELEKPWSWVRKVANNIAEEKMSVVGKFPEGETEWQRFVRGG